jgi:hypothetical protein
MKKNDFLARKQTDLNLKPDHECSTGILPFVTYLVSVCQGRYNFPIMITMK